MISDPVTVRFTAQGVRLTAQHNILQINSNHLPLWVKTGSINILLGN
jgi:hypothetical protein